MSAVQSAATAPVTFRVEVAASRQTTGYRVNRLYFLQGARPNAGKSDSGISADTIVHLSQITSCRPGNGNVHRTHVIPELVASKTVKHIIEVTLLPGVTDAAADNLLRAAKLLGVEGITRTATGQRYLIDEALAPPN